MAAIGVVTPKRNLRGPGSPPAPQAEAAEEAAAVPPTASDVAAPEAAEAVAVPVPTSTVNARSSERATSTISGATAEKAVPPGTATPASVEERALTVEMTPARPESMPRPVARAAQARLARRWHSIRTRAARLITRQSIAPQGAVSPEVRLLWAACRSS